MARRPRLFAAGVLYHVIVRGNQRQKIFTSDGNYQAYIERLACYRKKSDVERARSSDIYFLNCSILDSNGSPSRRSMKFEGN